MLVPRGISVLQILLLILLLLLSHKSAGAAAAEEKPKPKPKPKGVSFIFGDSLSDVGNNNYLSGALAKANFPWYGIDYGNGIPTGRFSNGRTVSDIIAEKMGLPVPHAYLSPSTDAEAALRNGVNYASGGGGILDETGWHLLCLDRSKYVFWDEYHPTDAANAILAESFLSDLKRQLALNSTDRHPAASAPAPL